MRIISLFILILYGNIYAYSQQVYRGTVNDSQTGKGIEDAVVSLLNEQMLIIDFTYTDKKGDFLISSDSVPHCIMLSHIGCEKQIMPAMKFKSGSTFILQNKGYKIKEVKVTSKRIIERKDTLIYSVSGFQMPQDRTIADVLKKMPGIEVLPSGQIKFEDKAISKLYIEGMDLMGNRYSLATNNLSNKVVKRGSSF